MLLSAQKTINGGSSIHVWEEDMGGHWSITDSIFFITEPLTLIHEIWRSGEVKTYPRNQADCSLSISAVHAVEEELGHPDCALFSLLLHETQNCALHKTVLCWISAVCCNTKKSCDLYLRLMQLSNLKNLIFSKSSVSAWNPQSWLIVLAILHFPWLAIWS